MAATWVSQTLHLSSDVKGRKSCQAEVGRGFHIASAVPCSLTLQSSQATWAQKGALLAPALGSIRAAEPPPAQGQASTISCICMYSSWQQQKMPGILIVPVMAKAHRDAAAVEHSPLSHLKELLHHQPGKVMATLAC